MQYFCKKLGIRVGRSKRRPKDKNKVFRDCDLRMWTDLVASLQCCKRVYKYCQDFNKFIRQEMKDIYKKYQ